MKKTKHLHRQVGHALHALMLTMLFLWSGNVSAATEGSGTKEDPYIFQNGETYTIAGFSSYYATFTAPSDGFLTIAFSDAPFIYKDDTFSDTDSSIDFEHNGKYGTEARYTLQCTSGTTYYLGRSFVMNGGDLGVSFSAEATQIELAQGSPTPEIGSVLNASNAQVSLSFNQKVYISQCTVSANGQSENLTVYGNNSAYISIEAGETLIKWYNAGNLNENDEIKFTLSGIQGASDASLVYGSDGTLELTYNAGPKPITLVSTTNTPDSETSKAENFYSYYMSDDNSGQIKLEFSGNVNTTDKPEVTLSCGNTETGDYYSETLDNTNVNVLANYIFVNLRGKLRRQAEDMGLSGTYDYITLKVGGVKDTDGNFAYSSNSGSVGTYFFTYNYKMVDYSPMVDWTPGSVISNDTESLELWLKETGGKAGFSGVEFKYTEDGTEKTASLLKGELTIAPDNDDQDARIITIPVPNINIDENTDVTVSLTGVERPDGLTVDIDADAMAAFTKVFTCTGKIAEEFKITSAVWHSADGDVDMINGQIAELTSGTTTTLTTNKDSEIGYAEWEIRGTGNPDEEYIRSGYLTGPSDEGFTISWYGESLEAGKTYSFTLNAWNSEETRRSGATPNVGVATFTIQGNKAAYVYSDVTLNTDISETIVLASAEENSITLEFSAPVTVSAVVNTGFGTSQDCTVESASQDGTQWTVTFPANILSSMDMFIVNVFAKDGDNKAVNKTANGEGVVIGYEDNTWFQINFTAEFNKPDFVVTPANESELESISTITFSYGAGISQNWNAAGSNITVYNKTTMEVIETFSLDDLQYDFNDESKLWITLNETITDPGTYVVEIPSEVFILGTSQSNVNSKYTIVTYVIKGESKPLNVTISPEAGNVTEIPATLVLTFPDEEYADVDWTYAADASLTDASGNTYALDFEYGAEFNQINVILTGGAITEEGTYTLSFPEGFFRFGEWGDVVCESPAEFVYVISTTGIDSIVAAGGGKVDVYNVNGILVLRNADAAAVKALAKGLYIINGKKVVIK